jgi:hypothetical protein
VKGRAGGGDAHNTLERTQPHEGRPRDSRFAARYDEEDPEVVKATWGERRKPIKRYSPDTTRP